MENRYFDIPGFCKRHKVWLLFSVLAVCGVAVLALLLAAATSTLQLASSSIAPEGDGGPQLPPLTLVEFTDPVAGFNARVPVRWQRVHESVPGDAGVTVSFESPPSGPGDRFADYLMIDIQPGNRVVILDETPVETVRMQVAGREVERERILLPRHPVADTYLDLVAWQLTWKHQGYSVGIYAIGERREEARLERLLIEFADSFSLPAPPFVIAVRAGQITYRSG